MNAMVKIKLSKERIQLIADLKAGNLKGLDKIKASKRVVEIVVLLGGKAEQSSNEQPIENDSKQPNPFFQAVINGEIEFSLQMVSDLLKEVQKDPRAPLAVEATQTAYRAFLDNGRTLDMEEWNQV